MKLKEIIKSITKNKYLFALIKGLASIGLIIAISAISVHYLTGNTLSEYAKSNPELAYGVSTEEIPKNSDDPDAPSASDTDSNQADNPADTDLSLADNPADTDLSLADNPADTDLSQTDDTSDTDTVTKDITSTDSDLYEGSTDHSGAETDTNNSTEFESTTNVDLSDVHISAMVHFYSPQSTSGSDDSDNKNLASRTYFADGFYYEPLTDEMIKYITGSSYPADISSPAITTDDLRYLGILYNDFNGLIQAGEIICNTFIAQDLMEIFYELYNAGYQFDRIVLVDNYGADDTASICADNTSCFNYRTVEGKTSLSKHAYGLAIDINPFYNPYLVFGGNEDGSDYISPPGSEKYIDRSASFPYKIDENDLCYKLFIEHGFTWGGNWNSCKDYQHFQKAK